MIVCWWCELNPCICEYSPASTDGQRGYDVPTINVPIPPELSDYESRWDFSYDDFCALAREREAKRRAYHNQRSHSWRVENDAEYAMTHWERTRERAKQDAENPSYAKTFRRQQADLAEEAEMHIRRIKDFLWLRETVKTWPKGKVTVESDPRILERIRRNRAGLDLFSDEDFEAAA